MMPAIQDRIAAAEDAIAQGNAQLRRLLQDLPAAAARTAHANRKALLIGAAALAVGAVLLYPRRNAVARCGGPMRHLLRLAGGPLRGALASVPVIGPWLALLAANPAAKSQRPPAQSNLLVRGVQMAAASLLPLVVERWRAQAPVSQRGAARR